MPTELTAKPEGLTLYTISKGTARSYIRFAGVYICASIGDTEETREALEAVAKKLNAHQALVDAVNQALSDAQEHFTRTDAASRISTYTAALKLATPTP